MSVRDALFYNVLTCGVLSITPLWVFLAGPASFAGGNLSLAILLAGVFTIPVGLAYAMLACSMPRTGGEYVYQSRILHPSVGFAVVFAATGIFSFSWVALSVVAISRFLSTLFAVIGGETSNTGMIGLSNLALTNNVVLVLGALIIGFLCFILIMGLKWYCRLQVILFYGMVASVLVIAGVSLMTSTAVFADKFNSVMVNFQNQPNAYSAAIQNASSAGFPVNQPFSWIATLGIAPLWFTGTIWLYYSTYQGGEIKAAGVFKNQLIQILGGLAGYVFLVFLYTFSVSQMVGSEFLNGMSYGYVNGVGIGGLPIAGAAFILFASVAAGPILSIVIFFGYVCNLIQTVFNSSFAPIRALFAMSFDRVLPTKVSDVDERFHGPWVASLIAVVLSVLWLLLELFLPSFASYLTVMMVTTTFLLMVSMVAAILFPFTLKDVYKASPISKYEVAGVPMITIFGIIGLIVTTSMNYVYVINPTYGASGSPIVIGLNVSIILGGFVYYFLASWYRKRQGIEIGLAFKGVPPE